MIDENGIRRRWESIGSKLDERERRLWAAAEVDAAGYGALAAVSRITGIARSTINRGEDDLDEGPLPNGRVRRAGGGGKPLSEKDPTLVGDLKRLVEPASLGSPGQPLLWVSMSRAKLARALTDMGHPISESTVSKLLTVDLGFSSQRNRKADEGSRHPDRNAQFEHINAKVVAALAAGQPVISIDTKKQEPIGIYRSTGSECRPKGQPQRVNMHDFKDKQPGRAVPYGVNDVGADADWVSLGLTSDTAEFAVNAIRTWIGRIGRARHPAMRELTIAADCGGANGARVRLWKVELQRLADEADLTLHVHHYPSGPSKWNKIEHRLFCHITRNGRARPLADRVAIVELIGTAATQMGLEVDCVLDERTCEKEIEVSDADMKALEITGDAFHHEWNYTIRPRRTRMA